MNEAQSEALDRVLEALCFYANSNIYHVSPKHPTCQCEAIQDQGELARLALYDFEGVFEVRYDVQTEI